VSKRDWEAIGMITTIVVGGLLMYAATVAILMNGN